MGFLFSCPRAAVSPPNPDSASLGRREVFPSRSCSRSRRLHRSHRPAARQHAGRRRCCNRHVGRGWISTSTPPYVGWCRWRKLGGKGRGLDRPDFQPSMQSTVFYGPGFPLHSIEPKHLSWLGFAGLHGVGSRHVWLDQGYSPPVDPTIHRQDQGCSGGPSSSMARPCVSFASRASLVADGREGRIWVQNTVNVRRNT